MGTPQCSKCKKIIEDEVDILWYKDKIYCPLCYGDIMKGKSSGGQVFGWIIGTIMCILSLILWVIYFAV